MSPYIDEGDVLGHEPVGIVEEVGSEVKQTAPGDRVVLPFNIACGQCFYPRAATSETGAAALLPAIKHQPRRGRALTVLYEGEKRAQAERFGAQMQAASDEEWTQSPAGHENGLDSGDPE